MISAVICQDINSEKHIGVATQFWAHKIDIKKSISLVDSMGFNSIRDGIKWNKVERKIKVYNIPKKIKKVIEEAKNKNVDPLIVLSGKVPTFYDKDERPFHENNAESYIQFVEFVARHFKGSVYHYEIGNEWNVGDGLRKFPKKKKEKVLLDYLDLLKKLKNRISSIDPDIKIVGPVFTGNGVKRGELEFMVKNGLLDAVDIVSFHGYPYKEKKGIEQTPQRYFDWIKSVEDMLISYNNGQEVPIYITEYSWPSVENRRRYSHYQASEEKQKEFLLKSLELIKEYEFIKGMWWFCLYDHLTISGQPHYGGPTYLGLCKLDDDFNIIKKSVVSSLINLEK